MWLRPRINGRKAARIPWTKARKAQGVQAHFSRCQSSIAREASKLASWYSSPFANYTVRLLKICKLYKIHIGINDKTLVLTNSIMCNLAPVGKLLELLPLFYFLTHNKMLSKENNIYCTSCLLDFSKVFTQCPTKE